MTATADDAANELKRERNTADEMRKKAMEKMGETKKRKLATAEGESSGAASCKNKKRSAQPLLDFLREKTVADRELKEQELEAMRKEKETQNSLMHYLMAQQQQMN